ncbi:hypothetical protein GFC29_3819 (plasmid) [Anoxybacillus sp. B7M1]|uniref:hypothetical protein n=1 Tax=Anoxybacillus sp. B7M1 TaxID=1490057 RepID=UPI0005CD9720|nr:hypothetical protein [Anoxybacillus sp. B7M1]ANB66180.1 hypothetical protein GFC29_3819 [Anoxybacillus sp. B7M1]
MAIRDGIQAGSPRVGQRIRERQGILPKSSSIGYKQSVYVPICDIFKVGDIQPRIRDNVGIYLQAAYTTTADSGYKLPVSVPIYDIFRIGDRIIATRMGSKLYGYGESSGGGSEPIQAPRRSPLEIRWKQKNPTISN